MTRKDKGRAAGRNSEGKRTETRREDSKEINRVEGNNKKSKSLVRENRESLNSVMDFVPLVLERSGKPRLAIPEKR